MDTKTLTLSSVGQITIPSSIRKLLSLEPGTKLDVTVDKDKNTLILSRQKTTEEVFTELERLSKKHPKPDPRARYMTVGEMSLAQINRIKGDTWV